MGKNLVLNTKNCNQFVGEHEVEYIKDFVEIANKKLLSKNSQGGEYTGWINLPTDFDKEEFERIKVASEKIRKNSDIFIIVGIGGSYLGAKAVIEALTHNFSSYLSETPKIIYAGNSISSSYLADLLDLLEDKDFSINVISKSGTTTEPAIAFRILKEKIIQKYGEENLKDRIFITTDKKKGALKTFADSGDYETFVVPDEIGGRYSVLTAVGLLPIAVAGIDIDALMNGARKAQETFSNRKFEENDSLRYVAYRNILHRKGKDIEILVNYEPQLSFFSEWYKQLYAESEGKDSKGIFPISVNFSTDLHSLGQYIQEGKRLFFETTLAIKNPRRDIKLKEEEEDLDGLNYLAGKTVDFVNQTAMAGTILAHIDGGVPNLVIEIDRLDEENIGYLVYFFEYACGVSGYLNGINPFDQPGVESYKKNMFALLGKKGFEKEREILEKRLYD